MGTELVPETLYSNEFTRLCARENYIVLHLILDFYCPYLKKVLGSLVQCIAVSIRFLLAIFKEGNGNCFLQLVDVSQIYPRGKLEVTKS
jgi:hypothetical protein